MDGGLSLDAVTVVRRDAGGERAVLAGVTAAFAPGTVSVLSGPTGSGKSTLLHVLALILRPDAGRVLAGGEPVSAWAAGHRDRFRRDVGVAFQVPRFLEDRNALENVLLRCLPRSRDLDAAIREARSALSLAGAETLAARPVASLSGGERQRVGLARALVGDPRFLLLDEPTAHQDDEGVGRVADRAREAAARGAVVVVATHDPRLGDRPADARWTLACGRLEG